MNILKYIEKQVNIKRQGVSQPISLKEVYRQNTLFNQKAIAGVKELAHKYNIAKHDLQDIFIQEYK